MSDESRDSHNDASRAEKKDKRQRLKKQMVAHYVLTAYVCHGGRKRVRWAFRRILLLFYCPGQGNILSFSNQEAKQHQVQA